MSIINLPFRKTQKDGESVGLDESWESKLEELYRDMFHPCFIYAVNALNDDSLAEEAVQDTFRIACEKADNLFASQNPKGWIIETLKNVIRNMKRARAQISKVIVNIAFDEGNSFATSDEENLSLLYSGIVSSEDFALLKKISVDGYSMLEAADELGITVEACKKRVQRARQKFRKFFEK